jgi:hypothetical protein
MRKLLSVILFVCLWVTPGWASEAGNLPVVLPPSLPDTLNRAAIQSAYSDGEFETLANQLEVFRLAHAVMRREDSLLVAKYLGVIYTAHPGSREKGKYWLYRLVQSDPRADLVDLYVSDEIQAVFDRVRREAITRRRYQGINDVELDRLMSDGRAGDEQGGAKDTVVLKDTVIVKNQSLPGAIIGLASSLETPAPAFANQEKHNKFGWTLNANALVGMKFMDSEAWDPVSNQLASRGTFDFRRVNWPINLVIDFAHTASKPIQRIESNGLVTFESNTQELLFGVRKVWDHRFLSLRPYCGGGVGLIAIEFIRDDMEGSFQQTGYGAWFDGGVYYELERHFNLGGRFWYSWASIDFVGGAANGGGTGFGIMAGFHY